MVSLNVDAHREESAVHLPVHESLRVGATGGVRGHGLVHGGEGEAALFVAVVTLAVVHVVALLVLGKAA